MRKLMWLTIGFAGACALGAGGCQYGLAIVVIAAVLSGLMLLLSRLKKSFRPAAMVCAGIAIGLSWFGMFESVYLSPLSNMDRQTVSVSIRAVDYSQQTDYGNIVDGEIDLAGKRYKVYVHLDEREEPPALVPGDIITGEFYFKAAAEVGWSQHLGNGIFLIAYQRGEISVEPGERRFSDYPAIWRNRILRLLENAFSGDTIGFAKALLLGDTTDLPYETDTAFKVSGIRHIVAVSGLHVSILFSVVYLLSGRKRLFAALLGIPVLVLFAAVTGFTPSVTRACVMQILMILAMLLEREYDPPTALAFAVLTMLCVNPFSVTSVSMQLSVGCLIGIFLFSAKIHNWILSDKCLGEAKGKGVKARLKRWFAGSVSITLSTMITTTPLCAWYFGMVSLVGILTNLLTLWIVSFLFYGIMLVCLLGLIWSPAANVLAWVVSWGARYVIYTAKLLAKFPFAAVYTHSIYVVIWLVLCYALLAVFLIGKKKYPLVYAGCVVFSLCAALLTSWTEPLRDDFRMTVLDVGQGQCILLQSDGRTYMVDCGGMGPKGTADEAANALLSQGVAKLDGLIITHYDGDHSEGAENLLFRMNTDLVLVPATKKEPDIKEGIENAASGDVYTVRDNMELTWSDNKITVIPSHMENSDNESGICVLFQTENCAILITGDRDAFGERMLLKNMDIPKLDALVVGHHGSRNSTGLDLLEATRPEVAIISVGENNPYGHPATETLNRLIEFGCKVYRTDLHGTIIYGR